MTLPLDEARHLVLVGMMGAGKSSVGRRLALRLGRPFVDTDHLVEERSGRSVGDIFSTDGEAAFRVLEAQVVRDALGSDPWAVIAFGGGAVLDPENRTRARAAGLVVWLRAEPRDLARRVAAAQGRSGGSARPLLAAGGSSPAAIIEALAAERAEAYRAAAHLTVETTGRSPSRVASAILAEAGWNAG